MGLFGRKKKPEPPHETNEMGNRELRENLADTALGLLAPCEDFDDLAGTKVEFGYIFMIEDHGIEALYKIITDKTTAYFAAQGDKLMRLNFNEELFKSTVENMNSMHGGAQ